MSLPADKVAALKQFVGQLQAQPELLHSSELGFFRDYLKSLDAKLPAKKEEHGHGHGHAQEHEHQHDGCCGHGKKDAHEHDHAHAHEHGHAEKPAEPDEEEEPEDPDPDLMTPDTEPPQEMGPDGAGEPSDADMDKASEAKMAAAEALSNGEFAKAVEAFTTAIKLMPSPLVYAKRADAYLKLKKPNAAMRDCDKALAANPDSAKALRVRGSAHRYLGNYEAAKTDLAAAQRIDYDDSIDAIQKFVNKRCADRTARQNKKRAAQQEKAKQAARHVTSRGPGRRRAAARASLLQCIACNALQCNAVACNALHALHCM